MKKLLFGNSLILLSLIMMVMCDQEVLSPYGLKLSAGRIFFIWIIKVF